MLISSPLPNGFMYNTSSVPLPDSPRYHYTGSVILSKGYPQLTNSGMPRSS